MLQCLELNCQLSGKTLANTGDISIGSVAEIWFFFFPEQTGATFPLQQLTAAEAFLQDEISPGFWEYTGWCGKLINPLL